MSSRATLDAARDATIDADRARRQLKSLEGSNDALAGRMRANLRRRLEADERARALALAAIDSCDALTDLQRDVLAARYVMALTWRQVARQVGYSPRPCQMIRNEGVRVLESHGCEG